MAFFYNITINLNLINASKQFDDFDHVIFATRSYISLTLFALREENVDDMKLVVFFITSY